MKDYFNTFIAPSKNRKCIRPLSHIKSLHEQDKKKLAVQTAIGRLDSAIQKAQQKLVLYRINRGTRKNGFAMLNLDDARKIMIKRILDIAYEIQRTNKWN